MKSRIHYILILLLLGFNTQAGEYKPLLEDGKQWRIGWVHRYLIDVPGCTMEKYVIQADCTIKEAVEMDGEICRRIEIRTLGSEDVREEFILEKDGVISLHTKLLNSESVPEILRFTRMMDFNCQVGDSLLRLSELATAYNYKEKDRTYNVVSDIKTTTDRVGTKRKEIIFNNNYGSGSWVEGIGVSTHSCMLGGPSGFASNQADYLFTIDCKKDGQTLFTFQDFNTPNAYNVLDPKVITPGKSWTLARGGKEFTVTVDRDTLLIPGFLGKVLKSSEGKEYVVAEEGDRVHAFFDHLGSPDPEINALTIMDCTSDRYIRRCDAATGRPTDINFITGGDYWMPKEVREKVVGGRTFKEHIIVSSKHPTKVVASWVEGVGAPDSRSWATVLPEGEEVIRLIDCRENGEVIFTAKDFSYPASIDEIASSNNAEQTIYDLHGRQVKSPGRGFYIIDGKKRFLK